MVVPFCATNWTSLMRMLSWRDGPGLWLRKVVVRSVLRKRGADWSSCMADRASLVELSAVRRNWARR